MKMVQTLTGACLFFCVALLAGCASPAQPGKMVVSTISHAGAQHDAVSVQVTGGQKTNPMLASQISGDDFRTALVQSLRDSGIFRSVDADGNAPYKLDVRLDAVEQPAAGFNMTVGVRSDWTLSKSQGGAVVWQQPIYSTYTATVGDAFVGGTRLRLANEGAARKNIEQGLTQLSNLKLDH
jgi:hypothetical protein